MATEMKNLCPACTHYGGCQEPCRPVKLYLAQGNRAPWESWLNRVIVVHPDPETAHFSAFDSEDPKKNGPEVPLALQADKDIFENIRPVHKMTAVFLDRFFHRLPYELIAEKYELGSSGAARDLYRDARMRLEKVLENLDRGEIIRTQVIESLEGLHQQIKIFLLRKIIGCSVSDIQKMLGIRSPNTVMAAYKNVEARIAAGEIDPFEFSPEKRAVLKERLTATRDRKRNWDRKKAAEKRPDRAGHPFGLGRPIRGRPIPGPRLDRDDSTPGRQAGAQSRLETEQKEEGKRNLA